MKFSVLDVNRQSNSRSNECAQLEDGPVQAVNESSIKRVVVIKPTRKYQMLFLYPSPAGNSSL